MSRYQKGKTNLDFTEARDSEVSGSGISWAICKSAPRSRQITTPTPHRSVFLQAGCPSCRPTNSVKALKAKAINYLLIFEKLHTHLTALFWDYPGKPYTRKVKPVWILLKQETVSGSGMSWDICKSATRSRQITMPAPHHSVFTLRCYASAVLAMALCLSVCLSVRVSVTSRSYTEMARRRITQTTPHDSPGTLVF